MPELRVWNDVFHFCEILVDRCDVLRELTRSCLHLDVVLFIDKCLQTLDLSLQFWIVSSNRQDILCCLVDKSVACATFSESLHDSVDIAFCVTLLCCELYRIDELRLLDKILDAIDVDKLVVDAEVLIAVLWRDIVAVLLERFEILEDFVRLRIVEVDLPFLLDHIERVSAATALPTTLNLEYSVLSRSDIAPDLRRFLCSADVRQDFSVCCSPCFLEVC